MLTPEKFLYSDSIIMKTFFKILFIFFVASVFITFLGCKKNEVKKKKTYLVKVGGTSITRADFEKAFEIHKTAYDYEVIKKPEVMKKALTIFLRETIEEMTLLERAKELGIDICEKELEKAIKKITKDYPEGEFEKTLLESAISYNEWKKQLKNRLIMEKVIENDLTGKIKISPDDIKAYRKKHFAGSKKSGKDNAAINMLIMERLKRKKTEEKYRKWVENLQKKYTVNINDTEWKGIIGS